MDAPAIASVIFAGISAAIAAYSAGVSRRALQISQQSVQISQQSLELARQTLADSRKTTADSLELNERIFKRQHVMDLHMSWLGFRRLDPARFDDPNYVPEIVTAGNLLALTATLWNHDVVERTIIEQSYWVEFDNIYRTLENRSTTIPGLNQSGIDLLTDDIQRAHEEMRQMHEENRRKRLAAVPTSTVRN